MSHVLFLDDDHARCHEARGALPYATIVTTAAAAIAALADGPATGWDVVLLDHDLGGEVFVDSDREDCGMEVVRWVLAHRPSVRLFLLHSFNAPAARAMRQALQGVGYRSACAPHQHRRLHRLAARLAAEAGGDPRASQDRTGAHGPARVV